MDSWSTKTKSKHYSRTIVSALVFDGTVSDEYVELIDGLLGKWAEHLPKNQLRRRYYDGENVLKDLGISIPPPLRNIETVVGWPKKAVGALACRSRFDGFTATVDGSADSDTQAKLDRIVRTSAFKRKYRQAVESELISGCDFITLSKGATGEPPVIITTHSAEDGAAEWDERLGRIRCGLVIMHYDDTGAPDEIALYTDATTLHVDAKGGELSIENLPHRMGRPLMEALAYNPTESQPLGQSRITNAVRSITDSGVREALRTEVSAEFFTSPQKYLLGVDGDPFENKTRWEAYIGNIFTVGQTENGDTPTFGQLSQGSMQPHTDYMRALAARFSGETNVPLSQLGIVSDNPSSAEAIYAANEPLIIEAERLRDDNAGPLVAVAQMALAIMDGVPLSTVEDGGASIVANFANPAMPSIVSQADAMVKIANVVPEFAGTEVFWEQLGFSEDMRRKTVQQMQANANRDAINSIMQGATAQQSVTQQGE